MSDSRDMGVSRTGFSSDSRDRLGGYTIKSDQSDYLKYRGKCKEMSEALIAQDPTLTLVRGHYWDTAWGQQAHWWCVAQDGTIVDPTKDQFPSKGTGLYVPFDGICTCETCGKEFQEDSPGAQFYSNYACCSPECMMRLVL